MASLAAAQLLDELMGRNRNLRPDEKGQEIQWDDPDVCQKFLCGFCPNELFINTRADLGPCEKIHDEMLRSEYQKSSRYQKVGYEEEFLRVLQGILNDVERRIRRGETRLSINAEKANALGSMPPKYDDKISMLTEKINGLLSQAEVLGMEGKVEEAQGVMKLCDQLKDEREGLRMTAEIATSQEKQMEVCRVCGAFLIVGDAQSRIDDHLMGKQHVGYARIRATVEEMLKKMNEPEEEREARRKQRELERVQAEEERRKRREQREKELEKEREERRKKREEERSSRSGRRSRSRSRDRDRRHRRSRSRSRDRRRRYDDRRRRSRSRGRRSRSRSRDRSRRHSDRRSRSRDRRRRSHSNDKKGSRSEEKDEARKSGDNDLNISESEIKASSKEGITENKEQCNISRSQSDLKNDDERSDGDSQKTLEGQFSNDGVNQQEEPMDTTFKNEHFKTAEDE